MPIDLSAIASVVGVDVQFVQGSTGSALVADASTRMQKYAANPTMAPFATVSASPTLRFTRR